ncbi:2380_t:CDS:2 [Cetraspora pellucida]|uniref:2380_t:CDS:1 n=1 Tax=Cetraspora pellucida TaxID=1433469 RepID=A0ACA9MTU3_9GLOM|nr:2380_t:CDS:2 [Cetraspora pellucida]
MSTKKQGILSAVQKQNICKKKEANLLIKNIDLAIKHSIDKSTISNILKEKEYNALNSGQDIDGESASVPPSKEIEKDWLVLQQLLQSYDSENI